MKVASPNGDGYFFRRSVNFVDTSVKRGDIYYADLSPVVGSEQGKARLPTHIALPVNESCGLNRDSIILLEQVRTLDKKRLRERMGHVEEQVMEKVDTAIAVSFGLPHDQFV